MLTIGLTGGIGSGKTAASNLFAKLGVPVIDADIIGHQITQPNHAAYNHIRAQWSDCFTSSGKLDRSALRRKVFSNRKELAKLEAVLHPAIQAEIENQKKQLTKENHAYCLIVIPLLLEKQWQHLVDKIIVVDIPEALQVKRTAQRDKIDSTEVESILSRQATREERLQAADFIIDNSGEVEKLAAQVSEVDALIRLERRLG
jgi:dephospho-CoA kinase